MKYSIIFLLFYLADGYFTTASSTDCNQSLLGRLGHGVITSYNYPFNYLHNLTCTYSIVLDPQPPDYTQVVCLTFHRFQLENSTLYCYFDYLKLEYVNYKYCGAGLWQFGGMTTFPGSNVWSKKFCWPVKGRKTFDITFLTDDNINDGGFYAEYFIFDGADTEHILPPGNLGQAPCADGQWTCFNRRCISSQLKCNGADDCGDGSDESWAHARCGEQNVLACDFSSHGGFSDGYCGFTHEGWFRTNEQHSPYGPRGDHTRSPNGYYVYSDVNQSSAYLLSPELSLPHNKTHCLTFWYYVYGSPAAAILRVFISRQQAYSRPEWSRHQVPENIWLRGQVVIHANSVQQVIFGAELDNSFSGVALDDISIMEGACLGNDISCNFESSTCGWTVTKQLSHLHGDLYGNLVWKLHSKLVGPMGPFWDHSSSDGGGNYLYVNYTAISVANSRAILISPPISAEPNQPQCLTFWYHMTGRSRDCCQLKVRILHANNSLSEPLWSQQGNVRSAWKKAYVDLNIREPYQLVVEGLVSRSTLGELAMDELLLMDGHCQTSSASACGVRQYLCADGQCVNSTLKCNGQMDCIDNSDEDWRAGCAGPSTKPSTSRHTTGSLAPSPVSSKAPPGSGAVGLCTSTQYRCRTGMCIQGNQRCDGEPHCEDHSDEDLYANCTGGAAGGNVACKVAQFSCVTDGVCIPESQVCDGTVHCQDGTDEDEETASCSGVLVVSGGLDNGAIVGIVVGCIICFAVIILSALLGRRRRKQRPRRRQTQQQYGSEISTISCGEGQGSMERHMSMLEAIRAPMQVRQPPPYSEQDLENMGYTSDGANTQGRRREVVAHPPPDEPPPPYDSVIKEQIAQAQARALAALNAGSLVDDDSDQGPSDTRGEQSSRSAAGPTHASALQAPLPLSSFLIRPHQATASNRRPTSRFSDESDSQNIYEELNIATLPRPPSLGRLVDQPSQDQSDSPVHRLTTQPFVHTLPGNQPGSPIHLLPSQPSAQMLPGHQSVSQGMNGTPAGAAGSLDEGRIPAGVRPPNRVSPPLGGRRTQPYPRIRLGTTALQRGNPSTQRPRNYSKDQGRSENRNNPPSDAYEPLNPPGPYFIRPNPYSRLPADSPESVSRAPEGAPNPNMGNPTVNTHCDAPNLDAVTGRTRGYNPVYRGSGRNFNDRSTKEREPNRRSYRRDMRPSNTQSYAPIPNSAAEMRPDSGSRKHLQQQPYLPPSIHQKPQAFSPHYTGPHTDGGTATPNFPRSGRGYPQEPYQPRNIPAGHDCLVGHTLYNRHVADLQNAPQDNGAFPASYQRHQDHHSPLSSGAASGGSKDWNNTSLGSSSSQDNLLSSPNSGTGTGSVPYNCNPNHPRAGSNISSDIDSTSPLVHHRDDSGSLDLDSLCPTSV